jgi:NarL family two-component system response regulator LiaR
MAAKTIRVLIADDHSVVRNGVRALLAQFADVELVAEANDGWEAISLFKRFRPDVILMDLIMPNLDGIEATSMITTEFPEARILMLTSFIHEEKLSPAIEAGALGYLLKDVNPQELVQSIRQIYQGWPSLDSSIAWFPQHTRQTALF